MKQPMGGQIEPDKAESGRKTFAPRLPNDGPEYDLIILSNPEVILKLKEVF